MNVSHKIIGACVVGSAMVAGAIWYEPTSEERHATGDESEEQRTTAARTIVSERPYIPETDSNGDGVPDWQETIKAVEPLAVEQILQATTSAVASGTPQTMTDEVAINVMERIIAARQSGMDVSQVTDEVIRSELASLQRETERMTYSAADVTVLSADTPEAIHSYVNQLADITLAHPLPDGTENELEILRYALTNRNTEDFKRFDPIIAAYENIVADTADVSVPPAFADLHVDLLNTYDAIATDLQAMRQTPKDPVFTMVRLKRYEEDVAGLYNVLLDMGKIARDEALPLFTPEDPVFLAFGFVLRDL